MYEGFFFFTFVIQERQSQLALACSCISRRVHEDSQMTGTGGYSDNVGKEFVQECYSWGRMLNPERVLFCVYVVELH